MSDPTRIDAGLPEAKQLQRPMAGIVIRYDPNTGQVQVQAAGLNGPVEELGLFEYAKQMRAWEFMKAAGLTTSNLVVPPPGARIKN
jgi:hypothetical protein